MTDEHIFLSLFIIVKMCLFKKSFFFICTGIPDPPTQRGIIPRAFEHIFEVIIIILFFSTEDNLLTPFKWY